MEQFYFLFPFLRLEVHLNGGFSYFVKPVVLSRNYFISLYQVVTGVLFVRRPLVSFKYIDLL